MSNHQKFHPLANVHEVLVQISQDKTGKLVLKLEPVFLAQVITEEEARHLCGISPRTWSRLRYAGDGPPFTRITDKRHGVRLIDLVVWLDERRYTPTATNHYRFGRPPKVKQLGAPRPSDHQASAQGVNRDAAE
jgi:hypothetical protein